jgi:hypothetical protein
VARIHGKDISTLTLGGQSLLADTVSIGLKESTETHDTTTIGDDWREFTAGLQGGDDLSHELFYDNANTTGTWAYLSGKKAAGAAIELVVSDGTRTTTQNVLVTGLERTISVSDMVKINATYKATGAVANT